MTSRKSYLDDNGGRCEKCNDPATEFQQQTAVTVRMGGGIGIGTMWMCAACIARREAAAASKAPT